MILVLLYQDAYTAPVIQVSSACVSQGGQDCSATNLPVRMAVIRLGDTAPFLMNARVVWAGRVGTVPNASCFPAVYRATAMSLWNASVMKAGLDSSANELSVRWAVVESMDTAKNQVFAGVSWAGKENNVTNVFPILDV